MPLRGGYKLSSIFDWVTDKISGNSISEKYYVTTDTMLQKCAGIKEYEGEIPNTVTEFAVKDILLSNIRPYLQKLWYSTFDGGCSNDVLVMRIKDTSVANPDFYAAYLKRPQFFDYIMQDVHGTKMPRGKKIHIMDYKVVVPNITKQNEVVAKVEELETKITNAKEKLDFLQGRITEVLDKYLK